MNAGALMVVLGCALVLASCSQRDREILSSPQGMRDRVASEMRAVVPRVTKEDLDACRTKLETPSWLGAKYEVQGSFQPEYFMSCLGQIGMEGLYAGPETAMRASFAVNMKKVAGAYGTGSAHDLGVCVFELQDEKIRLVHSARSPRYRLPHLCRQLKI